MRVWLLGLSRRRLTDRTTGDAHDVLRVSCAKRAPSQPPLPHAAAIMRGGATRLARV